MSQLILKPALLFFLLVQIPALAKEYHDLFPTPRGRGMGGAVTAIIDDYGSLSYNPAGLALIPHWFVRAPNLVNASFSADFKSFYTKVTTADLGDESQIGRVLSDFDGLGTGAGLDALGLGWFRPRMGIMLNLIDFNATLRLRTPSLFFARIDTRVTIDSGLSMGYAHPFFANHFRLGVVFRPFLVRGGIETRILNTDISDISSISDDLGTGMGSDVDVGIQGNLDPILVYGFGLKLMYGAVLQNTLSTKYTSRIGNIENAPPGLERRMNVGVAGTLDGLGTYQPTLSLELRDLGVETESLLEYLSAGVEFRFKPKEWFNSALRFHFYKGNVGGSLSGKLWFGELDVGTYAVNLGRGPGIGVDRRTFVSMAAQF